MYPALTPFSQWPQALKIAAVFLAIHILLYAKGVGQNLLLGNHIYPMWIFHILACVFIVTRIGRPSKSLFYMFIVYCIAIPTNMLRIDYVHDSSIGELLSKMAPTVLLAVPLYAAGVSFFFGRQFYLRPGSINSLQETHRDEVEPRP